MAMLILKSKTCTAIKRVAPILSMAILSACTTPTPLTYTNTEQMSYEFVPRSYVSISCVSHNGVPQVSDFSIEEPIASGPRGGKIADGASCGGIIAAGYALPNTWYPHMIIKVRWKPNGRDYLEKTINIIRYDEPGTIYIHFFKDDQVRVVVSAFNGPGNSRHLISMSAEDPAPEEE